MAHTLQSASLRHPVAVVTSTSDGASILPRCARKPNGGHSWSPSARRAPTSRISVSITSTKHLPARAAGCVSRNTIWNGSTTWWPVAPVKTFGSSTTSWRAAWPTTMSSTPWRTTLWASSLPSKPSVSCATSL